MPPDNDDTYVTYNPEDNSYEPITDNEKVEKELHAPNKKIEKTKDKKIFKTNKKRIY